MIRTATPSDGVVSDAVPVPPLGDFIARRFAAPSPPLSWALFERIGGGLAWVLAQFGTPPAVPTAVGGALGITGAALLATSSTPLNQLGAGALLLGSYALDCTDGQLARATRRASARGAWLDVATDALVISFLTAALGAVLLTQGHAPLTSMLIAGAYGASRTVSLFTSTLVRAGNGGLRLTGLRSMLRSAYVALIDTPVGYIALCAARPHPAVLVAVLLALAALTTGQAVTSASHHFRALQPQ